MIISIFFSFFTSLLVVGFNSEGTGDLNIKANINNILSNTITIEQVWKYITDFSNWTGTIPQYSDFKLPTNHEIIVKFKNNPSEQIGYCDTNNNWVYAWNIGFSNVYYVAYKNKSHQNAQSPHKYKITYEDTTLKCYVNNSLIHTLTVYNPFSGAIGIRLYNNTSNIEYLKINEL